MDVEYGRRGRACRLRWRGYVDHDPARSGCCASSLAGLLHLIPRRNLILLCYDWRGLDEPINAAIAVALTRRAGRTIIRRAVQICIRHTVATLRMKIRRATKAVACYLVGRAANTRHRADLPGGAVRAVNAGRDRIRRTKRHTTAIGLLRRRPRTATAAAWLRILTGRTAGIPVRNERTWRTTRARFCVVLPAARTVVYERLLRRTTTGVLIRHLPDRAASPRILVVLLRGNLTWRAAWTRIDRLWQRRKAGAGGAHSQRVVKNAGAVGLQLLRQRTEPLVGYDPSKCRAQISAAAIRQRDLALRTAGPGVRRCLALRATGLLRQADMQYRTRAGWARGIAAEAHAGAVGTWHLGCRARLRRRWRIS